MTAAMWRLCGLGRLLRGALLAGWVWSQLVGAVQGATIGVSPSALPWTSNAWVSITIGQVAAGAVYDLRLYADADGDGVVDPEDLLVTSFRVADGQPRWLEAESIPYDLDGAADGVIRTRISYHGSSVFHIIGAYIWRAAPTAGGASVNADFHITQPAALTWFTGSVRDAVTSNPVPCAVVWLGLFSDHRIEPAAWTGPNGEFRIDLPAGVPPADVREMGTVAFGYFCPDTSRDGLRPMSVYSVPTDPAEGQNTLPRDLLVVSAMTGLVHHVSGQVVDSGSNPVAAAWVGIEWGDDFESLAVADTNGCFRLSVPETRGPANLWCGGETMGMRKFVGCEYEPVTVTGNVAALRLEARWATLLVKMRVTAAESGVPIAGVFGYGEQEELGLGAEGYSLGDGFCELPLVAAAGYRAGVDDSEAAGYCWVPEVDGLAFTNAGATYTNVSLALSRGYILAGHIYGPGAETLTGGYVGLFADFYHAYWDYSSEANRGGYYEIFAPAGTYGVGTDNFQGHISQNFINHFRWEWGDEGVLCDPVTLTTNGLAGIDFHLPRAARIEGQVRGGGVPLPGLWVTAYAVPGGDPTNDDDWSWRGWGNTDTNGFYSIDVLPGPNYAVNVGPPEREGLFWLAQYYSNAVDRALASLVTTSPEVPAENVDFELTQGGIISGWVYQENGTTPVPHCWVNAETLDGDEVDGCGTDDEGYYEIILPPGSYRVVAHGGDAPYGVRMYYSGWYGHQVDEADVVTVVAGQVTGPIDFSLDPGCTLSGRVTREDGMTPVPGCWVAAWTDGWFMGDNSTDEDGYYAFRVSPGVCVVEARPDWRDLPYASQYYSNAVLRANATPLSAENGGELANIDFRLQQGGTLSGRVYAEADAAGIGGCHVYADEYDSGEWMKGTDSGSDGSYTLRLPEGRYRVRAYPRENGLPYVDEWYSNAMNGAFALAVEVADGADTPDIDFALSIGSTISGHVYREDGETPLADCHVFATDYDSNDWMDGTDTEADGGFTLRLPPGSYRVRAYPADRGLPYESKFYSDTYFYDNASRILLGDSVQVEGVDFVLGRAGTVSGHIYAEDGNTPLQDCHVGAEDYATGEWMGWDDTAADGSYRLVLPTGSYRVVARPSERGMPYVDLWYSNTTDWAAALAVEVSSPSEVVGIDFALSRASYIEGRVTDRTSGLPIAGMNVYAASIPDTSEFWDNWSFFGAPLTRGDGHYSIIVPPGSNYIVQTDSGESCYPSRCWSNQIDRLQATLLTVPPDSTLSSIDFAMEAGGRITGRIWREDDGRPLRDCDIHVENYMSGEWADGKRTDAYGRYSLAAPAGTVYRVRAMPSNNGLPYVDEWFNDTVDWNSAYTVPVTLLNETGGIDFRLMLDNLSYESWKAHYFTAAELADPDVGGDDADPDNDRAVNQDEYVADTHPRMSNSVLRMIGTARPGSDLRIEWKGGRWARQYVEKRGSLGVGGDNWIAIHTNSLLPTVVTNFLLDTDAAQSPVLYRIKAER